MHIHVDFCVIPLGTTPSFGEYIAECLQVLDSYGLSYQLHAYGTNIEGEWDEVMAAIKACHVRLHGMGAPRIHTQLKIGSRTDRSQTLQDKIDSAQHQLKGSQM